MLRRGAFLGQVAIRGLGQAQMHAGAGFQGPFGMYSDIGQPGQPPAPPGFPSTTPEIATPGGESTEKHCYLCSDGQVRSMTIEQARTTGGCQALPPSDPRCAGFGPAAPAGGYVSPLPGAGAAYGPNPSMFVQGMAGRRLGAAGPSSPGTTSAPAGTPAGQSIAQAGQPNLTQETQFFGPQFGYPYGYPGYSPPQSSGMTCKKIVNPDTGEETYDCVPKAGPAPGLSYRYPVYFVNPFFF